ncbi:MAG: phenylalanine--tRNA ligase subunit alpha, partial [Candidatus Methanomethylophilus sp.]|nr:phenylalanine--tRNA ligase subunit alpha [Methanomethylophilus sp.]
MDMKELLEGLSYNEKRLLLALDKNNGRGSPADMIRIGGFGLEVEVMGSASWLASKGLAEISEESTKYFELTDPEASRRGLPERNALKVLDAHGGSITLTDFAAEMNGKDNIAVGWLMRKKLASMQEVGGEKGLVLSDNGKAMLNAVMPDEELISRMLEAPVPEAEADAKIIKDLKGRKGMIKEVVETVREIRLTDDGVKAARSGIEVKEEITEVTDEIIQSGKWKDVEFRKYDVQTFAPAVYTAKKNPLTRLGNEVRRMFTEMGFSEMSSEYVQTAFWNMDTLFIPQDHPARDMQDTFFLENPSRIDLDDRELVAKIKAIHENGGDTGSTGWGGGWSEDKAS